MWIGANLKLKSELTATRQVNGVLAFTKSGQWTELLDLFGATFVVYFIVF